MAFSPITINIPIEIDAGAFATATTVQGETVTYNKVHLPLAYRTAAEDPTVQNVRDTFQFKEAEDQTQVTVDISGGAIGSFANGTAVVKALFKAALDSSELRNVEMGAGVIYADGSARDTAADPVKFYANKDTHTVGTGAGSTLKAYLLEYLYENISAIIGAAATTGTMNIDLTRDGVSASEIIAEALVVQLCGSGTSEQGIAAAALRQNIYEQMFTLAPERFTESTLMRRDPAGNIAYQDLPFQLNDTLSFLVTFKFPASQISIPVTENALRTGQANVLLSTGDKISVTTGIDHSGIAQSLLSNFPDCTVMMRVQLADGIKTPAAPTDLSVTIGDSQVVISFTAGSDNGSPITNYKYSTDNGVTYTALSPEDSVSPITITGLSNGTTYQVKLRAVNSIGDGTESAVVEATPVGPPPAPTGLMATVGDQQVTIAFTAGSDGGSPITNYKYSTNNGATYTAFSPADTASPVMITGLTNGTTYQIKLLAVNSAGDGAESAAVEVTPAGVPAAPTGLSADATNGQAVISFTAGSDGGRAITNYKYSIDGGENYYEFSPAVTSSPVTITGLTNTVSYPVRLRAVNALGDGDQSATIIVTPLVSGQQLWGKFIGASGNDYGTGTTTDSMGNVYVTGYTSNGTGMDQTGFLNTRSGTSLDAYIIKYSSTGTQLWGRYIGGSSGEYGYSITTDKDDNVYAVGNTYSTTGMDTSGFLNSRNGTEGEVYIIKYSPTGTQLWGRFIGANGTDNGYGVATDANGNVFVIGNTYNGTGMDETGFINTRNGTSSDAFIVKYSSTGTQLWGRYIGTSGSDVGNAVATDINGNVYIAGSTEPGTGMIETGFLNTQIATSRNAYIIKYGPAGEQLWGRYINRSATDIAFGLATDSSANVYIVGSTNYGTGMDTTGFLSTPISGSNDAFIIKYNANGTQLWGRFIGASSTDEGYAVTTDIHDNVFVTGSTLTGTNMNETGFLNTRIPTSSNSPDGFIIKYSSNGTQIWGRYIGASQSDESKSIATDKYGGVYVTGHTFNGTDMDTTGFLNTRNGTNVEAFIIKYKS